MKKFMRTLAIVLCLSMFSPSVVPIAGTETVHAASKTKIKLNRTNKTMYEGDTFTLKITGTKKKVKWSSSNKKVATISSKGIVKGINGGTNQRSCKIYATVGGKKYTCKVTVKGSYLNTSDATFEECETKELWIIGNKQDVIWSSEDENIAIVVDGNVTGMSAGTTNIIATTETKTYKCKVTITKRILISDISVQDSLKMRVGETTKISVSPIPINSTEKLCPVFASNDISIINVSPEGNVIANKSGQTQIIVSFKDIKKIINVTVEKTKAELIEEENNRYEKQKQDLRNEYNKNIDTINNQLTALYNQGYYLGSYSNYQQEYNDVNKDITRYTKQISILELDTSDENQKTLRELRSKLQDAQEKANRLSTQWANRELIDNLKENKVTIENNYNSKLNEIEQIHNQNINNIQAQK